MANPSATRVASRHIEAYRNRHDKIIDDWFDDQLDPRTKRLIQQANHDLYEGPHSSPGYPGFERATRMIGQALDRFRTDLWLDQQSDMVQDSEPEGWEDEETGEWIEPDWHDWIHYDWSDVKRIGLGALAEYVN